MTDLRRFARIGFSSSAAITLALLAGGCVDRNDRLVIGDLHTPEAVQAGDAAPETARPDDAPSLRGLDRSHWAPSDYAAAYDGTRHRPHYRTDLRFTNVTARQLNRYPTLLSALELNGDEFDGERDGRAWAQRLAEVGAAPFHAALEGVLIAPKLIGEPQTLEEWSPDERYERRPNWDLRAHHRFSDPAGPMPSGHDADRPDRVEPVPPPAEPTPSADSPPASDGPLPEMTPVSPDAP